MPRKLPRPTDDELAAAHGKPVADLIAPGLEILFVGINPSLWSAVIGHHFGNPNNRIWPTLHQAGFTPRRLLPTESAGLLARGYGITNLVNRATATAAEVSPEELRAGAPVLADKVARYGPRTVAFLGLSAYRTAFDRPRAPVGPQHEPFAGARVWLLPNPSGLNAHYQIPDLVRLYGELLTAASASAGPSERPPHERG